MSKNSMQSNIECLSRWIKQLKSGKTNTIDKKVKQKGKK